MPQPKHPKFELEVVQPYSTFVEGSPAPIPHIIDGLLPRAAFSVLGGKAKHGKSSMSRIEAVCVSKGLPFLDRQVEQGETLLCSLEDPKQHVDNCLKILDYNPRTLKSQVAQHELIIAELNAVNADLSQRVSERVTEIVPDHETREENEKLRATQKETLGLLRFLTSSLGGNPDGKARLAVRVIQNFPASAQEFLPLIGCDYSTFMRGMRMSDQELLDILEKSQNPNGEMCIVARACLATATRPASQKIPAKETYLDTRPLDVKMAEADAAVKALRGPGGFKSPILNITANPAPQAQAPSKPPAEKKWHEETFALQALDADTPRRNYGHVCRA